MRVKVEKYKNLNICNFYLLENMNHVNRNKFHNYFYIYSIQETEENFKKLEEVIENREFIIYRKLLYIIDNCWIVGEDSSEITVEIDILEHRKLLDDLANKFFTKKISTRKVQKMLGTFTLLAARF